MKGPNITTYAHIYKDKLYILNLMFYKDDIVIDKH